MDKDKMEHSDQAEALRAKMEQKRSTGYSVPPIESLPPRKQAHPKPQVPRSQLLIGGAVLLLFLAGGGLWAYEASKPATPAFSNGNPSGQPADKTGSQAANNKSNAAESSRQNTGSLDSKQAVAAHSSSDPHGGKQAGTNLPASGKPAVSTSPAGAAISAAQTAKPPAPAAAPKPCPPQKTQPAHPVTKIQARPHSQIIYHRVRAGETLYRLSLRYYKTGRYQYYLANYNGIKDTENVFTGTIVKIPVPPR